MHHAVASRGCAEVITRLSDSHHAGLVRLLESVLFPVYALRILSPLSSEPPNHTGGRYPLDEGERDALSVLCHNC